MAYNSFATNDANAVKYWSRRLEVETAKALEISRLMGEGEDSIIQVQSELTKDTGDKVTFDLLMQLTGDGFTENETMEGSEESFTFYPDSLLINELHNSVRFPARANINQQRVPWNLRDKAKTALREWFKVRYTKSFFNQVCGNTVTGLSDAGAHVNFICDMSIPTFNLTHWARDRSRGEAAIGLARADAHRLPFGDGRFDACQSERVAQSLPVAITSAALSVPGAR